MVHCKAAPAVGGGLVGRLEPPPGDLGVVGGKNRQLEIIGPSRPNAKAGPVENRDAQLDLGSTSFCVSGGLVLVDAYVDEP